VRLAVLTTCALVATAASAHPGACEKTIDLPMPGHWKADVHIAATGGKSTTLTLPFFVDFA